MAVPHSIALAATGLDPENGLGVVKAWVESGGDANSCWDAEIFLQCKKHGGALLEIAQRQWCSRS